MPPSKSSRVLRLAVLSATGLALGAVLGYGLSSAPTAAPPVVTPPPAIPIPVQPLTAEGKKQPAPAPWPTDSLFKGGMLPLAEFETWLAGASCDEVTRQLLDPAINGYPSHPAVCGLILSRYREFTVDERFICLQRHLTGDVRIMYYGLLPVLSDLAKATLPRRADEMLALFKKGNQLPFGLAASLTDWAAADFPAALAFIGRLERYEKDEIIGGMVAGLAEKDLGLAQREALKLPPGRARNSAVNGLAARMGKQDLAGALNWISDSHSSASDIFGRGPLLSAMNAAAMTNPAAAAQLIADLPGKFEGEGGPDTVRRFFQLWAGRDPAGAAAWLEEHPLSERHQQAAGEALATVRRSTMPLDDAVRELGSLPETARRTAGNSLIERLVAEDPAGAFERVRAIFPDKASAHGLWENLLGQLPNEYLPRTIAQFPELLDQLDQRSHLLDRLTYMPESDLDALLPKLSEKVRDAVRLEMVENASSDPGRALAIAQDMDRNRLSPFASGNIAVQLLQTDPARAVEWVTGFPEGENKEWAALNLASNWTRHDPTAAMEWLETLPPGRARDRASAEAAGIQGLSGNSQAALALAAGIQDGETRAEATGRALSTLWRTDSAAATAALQASGLAEDRQAGILQKLRNGGYGK